jgi:dGTPase
VLIGLSSGVLAAADELRAFMFERVYMAASTRRRASEGQAAVRALYTHFERHPERITGWSLPDDPPWRRAADYVSGMTDGYALRLVRQLGLD